MWYILEIDYEDPHGCGVKMHGCSELADAQRIFDTLELGYRLDSPVRVKDDRKIKVRGVRLFESFRLSWEEAFQSVQTGSATLMQEASAIEIGFDDNH